MREALSFVALALRLHFAGTIRLYLAAIVVLIVVTGGSLVLFKAPASFPRDTIVTIPSGVSLGTITSLLATDHVIAHPQLLLIALRLSGASLHIQAGDYSFTKPIGLVSVAYRLATGKFELVPERVTLPEGLTAREMSLVYSQQFSKISASDFVSQGKPHEGYLFPDTYSFLPNITTDTAIQTMLDNFDIRIASITPEISTSGHSLSDIVIMASLLEREAKSFQDKQMVAGILWNRIKLGMPLQVDAVFGYIHDRDTYAPSLEDLKVDSPYNTYLNKGLPPGPIDNPGLESLEAAATPTATKDLYYLTGSDGTMHYAATFEEHKANRLKYL